MTTGKLKLVDAWGPTFWGGLYTRRRSRGSSQTMSKSLPRRGPEGRRRATI